MNPNKDPPPTPDVKSGHSGDTAETPATKPGSKSESKPKTDLQTLPLAEVEKQLGFSSDGLSEAEAKKRLAQYGPNEIAEKKTNSILKFLSYLWGPIPWMIKVAVILSGVVQHWADFFIILFFIAGQRCRWILGGTYRGQRRRRFEGHTGSQGAG